MEATQRIVQGRAVAVAKNTQCDTPRLHAGAIIDALAWSLAGALFLSSAWLLVRRLTGALEAPLDSGLLITVGVCAVLCAAATRLLWRGAANGTTDSVRPVRDWLPTIALVFVATSAVVPGSSISAAIVLWSMIAAEEIAAALLARLPTRPSRQSLIMAQHRSGGGLKTRPRATDKGIDGEARVGSDVWQHHTRERVVDGSELVHGTLRAGFVAGQRTASEHVVFCPMLSAVPRITAMALDQLDCSVRATHIYRYGARLEIRLPEPCDEPVDVLVHYEARA
jgi:hypothetical protein